MTNENDWSNWTSIISNYLKPSRARSWWQLINSVIPYFALLVAMYYSMQVSYWLALAIAPLAAGFMVRIFIIFHDCGHGSFFRSELANRITGPVTEGVEPCMPSPFPPRVNLRPRAERFAAVGANRAVPPATERLMAHRFAQAFADVACARTVGGGNRLLYGSPRESLVARDQLEARAREESQRQAPPFDWVEQAKRLRRDCQ